MPIVDGGWSGPVPNPGEPGRKEFEQYLASSMSPDQYAQLAANPGSVLSPGFSERVQRETQGRQQVVAQGLDDPYSSYVPPVRSAEDVARRHQAVTMAGNGFGVTDNKESNLDNILSQFIDATISGDIKRAAILKTRYDVLGGLGFTEQTIFDAAELVRPGFTEAAKDSDGYYNVSKVRQISPNSYYNSSTYGDRWRHVAAEKARGDFSNEDLAFAYGLSKDVVDRELAQRPTWTKDAQGYLREGDRPRDVLPTGTGTGETPAPAPTTTTQDDMLARLRDMGLTVTDARPGTGADAGTAVPPTTPPAGETAVPEPGLIAAAVAPADPIRSTGYPDAPRDPAPAPLVTPNVGGKVITGTDVNVTDASTKTLKDEVQGKVTGTAETTPATITNVYDPATSTLVTPATQTTPEAGVADGKVTMASPTLPANFRSLTKDQKATLYASMRQQGFTDADIRAAAGTQDEASWQALRRLAGYDVPTVATVKTGNTARVKQNNFGGLLATASDPLAAANMAALAGSQAPGIIGSARTNPFAPPPTTVRLPPGVTPWWPGNGG